MENTLNTCDIKMLLYASGITYAVVYTVGMSYYAIRHFITVWKEKMWETAPESQVIEEIKYIIRKHNECANLDTIDSVISESIALTKYSESYRIECYRQGLKERVRLLENV
jgi:hypothetical protein